MKIIQSLGGPLIGLDRDQMHRWTGTDGKGFVGDESPFPNDYEAAGDLVDGRSHAPCNIAKIAGAGVDGLLITSPLETAVIAGDGNSVYIAQADYAEADWTLSMVSKDDFDKAAFDPNQDLHFSCKACTYIFFDAAYPGSQINDDYISFELNEGDYIFSTSIYRPDELTGLVLYKIRKASNG